MTTYSDETREQDARAALRAASRVVIKVGSRVLVNSRGRPELTRIKALVKGVSRLIKGGCEVVLVSSGAIGAGMEALSISSRPRKLPELQMAAAVGQIRLMSRYDELFRREGITAAQVLLTRGDLHDRHRHLNARTTMMRLLANGIVPIVNENDVVAVDEIKFGDNDVLAALVAILIEADVFLALTMSDGLRAPTPRGRTRRVSYLPELTAEALSFASGAGSKFSTGGMQSKLKAAEIATKVGISVVIADGRRPSIIQDVLAGKDVGTLLGDPRTDTPRERRLRGKKRWIAFFNRAEGTVVADEGACRALGRGGNSLLPIGVCAVEGNFGVGAMVNVRGTGGELVARGLVGYSSEDIEVIKGARSADISSLLGVHDYDEVIHRDNMVVLDND